MHEWKVVVMGYVGGSDRGLPLWRCLQPKSSAWGGMLKRLLLRKARWFSSSRGFLRLFNRLNSVAVFAFEFAAPACPQDEVQDRYYLRSIA